MEELARESIDDSDQDGYDEACPEAREIIDSEQSDARAHDDRNDDEEYEKELAALYMNDEPNIQKHSRFIEVVDETGESRITLKSSLLWSYLEPGVKMSNDRTKRFKHNTGYKRKKNAE